MNYLDGQLMLIPNVIAGVVTASNNNLKMLLDLETCIDTFSSQTTANLILANDLYNPKESKFLFDALYATLNKFDFMGSPFAKLNSSSPEKALQLRRELEGGEALFGQANLDRFVTSSLVNTDIVIDNNDDDDEDTIQFYVPELLEIDSNIYGVRLKAITVSPNGKAKLNICRDSTVAMLGLLGKQYDPKILTSTQLFKEYLRLCRELGTT